MSSKLASLHAGLVARKGEAMPAISHPAFSYVDTPRPIRREDDSVERRSFSTAANSPAPARVEQRVQQRAAHESEARPQPQRSVAAPAPRKPKREKSETQGARSYQLTFRMTRDQRRRLQIAAAQTDKSLQQTLSDAIDNHLDGLCACSLKECACMARNDAHQH